MPALRGNAELIPGSGAPAARVRPQANAQFSFAEDGKPTQARYWSPFGKGYVLEASAGRIRRAPTGYAPPRPPPWTTPLSLARNAR